MAIIKLVWFARADACKICAAINGYVWTFDTSTDELPNELIHPVYGVVWDMANGSMAHGHEGLNCRCHVGYNIDISLLVGRLKQIIEVIQTMAIGGMKVGQSWRTRSDVRTRV